MSEEDFSRCVCCGKAETRVADVELTEVKKHLVPAIPRVIQPTGAHRIVICIPCNHRVYHEGAIIKEIRYQKLLTRAANQAFR